MPIINDTILGHENRDPKTRGVKLVVNEAGDLRYFPSTLSMSEEDLKAGPQGLGAQVPIDDKVREITQGVFAAGRSSSLEISEREKRNFLDVVPPEVIDQIYAFLLERKISTQEKNSGYEQTFASVDELKAALTFTGMYITTSTFLEQAEEDEFATHTHLGKSIINAVSSGVFIQGKIKTIERGQVITLPFEFSIDLNYYEQTVDVVQNDPSKRYSSELANIPDVNELNMENPNSFASFSSHRLPTLRLNKILQDLLSAAKQNQVR
jgi:hypothetical protein